MLSEDDELPEDEEEMLVYVEFDGSVASNALSNEKLQLNIIGLDMEHPIMQVNGKFYEGTYHDAMGTCLLFEKDNNPHVDDPVFDSTPTLKYFAKTRKILKMSRIFVELKTDLLGDSNAPECIPSMETIDKTGIPPRYREEALKSWEKMRDDRMKALNDYLEKQRIRNEKRLQGIEPDSASDDDNPFAIYKPEIKNKKNKQAENAPNILVEESSGRSAKDPEKEDSAAKFVERLDEHDSNVLSIVDSVSSTLDKTMIIDPGPSTSKNSKPWKSPPMEEHDEGLPNVTGMHKATIQVTKKAKLRKCGKLGNKKSKKGSAPPSVEPTDQEMVDSKKANETDPSKIFEDDRTKDQTAESEDTEKIILESTKTLECIESLSISQCTEELSENMDYSELEKNEDPASSIGECKLEKQRKRDEKMQEIKEKLKKAADEQKLKNQQDTLDSA